MDNKIPPHNSDFEISTLSSCLQIQDDLDEFASRLSPVDFYDTRNRLIYSTALELHHENNPANLSTVAERLISSGNLEKAGGGVYISRLLDEPMATDPKFYAEKIKDYATRRRLIESGNAIMKLGYNQEIETIEAVDKAQAFILGIDCNRNVQEAFPLKNLILESGDRLEALQKGSGGVTGVPSGFSDLDMLTCGLQPSDLQIWAGRPAMGKTSLAINISLNAAKQGYRCGINSLEMSKEQITNRFIALDSGVNLLKFQSGRFSGNDWNVITAAQEKLYKLPIWIDDTPALSYGELRRRARRMKNKYGIDVLFVDYIQLMQGDKQNGRVEEVSSISRNLKATAKELNIPVVALSQLNRAVELRDNKRPRLADLRDSGAIEQDGDLVLFLYRDEYYNPKSPHKGIADLIIAKHRNGPTGTIGLHWKATTTKFSNLAPKN